MYVNVLSLKAFQAFEIKNSYLHNKGLLQCYTTRQYYSILQTVSSGALALRILDSTYVVVHSMYYVCNTIEQKVLFPSPQRIWRRLRFAALNSFRTAAHWTKKVKTGMVQPCNLTFLFDKSSSPFFEYITYTSICNNLLCFRFEKAIKV